MLHCSPFRRLVDDRIKFRLVAANRMPEDCSRMVRRDMRPDICASSSVLWVCLALVSIIACAPSGGDSQLFRKMPQGDLPSAGKTFGACVLDLNHDDYPDLLLSTHGDAAVLLTSQPTGVFQRLDSPTRPSGLFDQHGAAACDYDNDGLWDAYITVGAHRGQGWSLNQLWRQRQDGGFDNEWLTRGLPFNEGDVDGSAVDFDNDGRFDLAISRDKKYEGAYTDPEQKAWFGLMHQQPDGRFLPRAAANLRHSSAYSSLRNSRQKASVIWVSSSAIVLASAAAENTKVMWQ